VREVAGVIGCLFERLPCKDRPGIARGGQVRRHLRRKARPLMVAHLALCCPPPPSAIDLNSSSGSARPAHHPASTDAKYAGIAPNTQRNAKAPTVSAPRASIAAASERRQLPHRRLLGSGPTGDTSAAHAPAAQGVGHHEPARDGATALGVSRAIAGTWMQARQGQACAVLGQARRLQQRGRSSRLPAPTARTLPG
jgi:hypothetical protein